MSIFNFYPYINYNNQKATYILGKAELVSKYLKDYNTFYYYTIKEGERADIVAYNEYNDSSLDWIIYLINNVTDPYYDWYMTPENFISYLESKYNTSAYKLTSLTIPTSIHHYYYTGLPSDTPDIIASYNYTMTPGTYSALGNPPGWTPKSIWEYETEINEKKRDIKLLRPVYLNNFQQQFKDLFVNG